MFQDQVAGCGADGEELSEVRRGLLDAFAEEYNDHRPHRSLPHRATPATIYTTRPKATPSTGDHDHDTHDRVRYDKVDKAGKITWLPPGPTP
ncbi:integrase core domain-containing protein [Nocardioides hungaricus]